MIETEKAIEYVANIMVDYAGGCTITAARGYYRHEDGALCFENTIKCEVYGMSEENALKAVEIFKASFNQESVQYEQAEVDSKLL